MIKAIILNDTRTEQHYGCDLVMKNLILALKQRGVDLLYLSPVGNDWRKDEVLLKLCPQADFAIINGEGTIHHDQPSAIRLLEFATFFKSKYKKKVFLINALYQEMSKQHEIHLSSFDKIWCRDNSSKDSVIRSGYKAEMVPDLTLARQWEPPNKHPRRNGIGVSDSVFMKLSEKLFLYSKKFHYDFLPILRHFKILNFNVTRSYLSLIKSRLILALTYFLIGKNVGYVRKRRLSYKRTLESLFNSIQSKELVVCARFHTLCLCLLTETPFLAITSNSHKMEAIISDIGLSQDLILTEEVLLKQPITPPLFNDQHIELIRCYKQSAQAKAHKMFDEIVENVRLT